MYVRLTYLNFLPEKINKAKNYYDNEVVPAVKKQKGNIDCLLLEPANKGDDHISMTLWENKEDANAYQSSGLYKSLVEKLRDSYSKEPVLRVYSTESIMEHHL